MLSANLLRALTYAAGAAYLIFTQNHSLILGANIILYLATATALGGFALMMIPNIQTSLRNLLVPSMVGFAIALFGVTVWFGGVGTDSRTLWLEQVLIGIFIGAIALTELVQSFIDLDEDVLELRISAGIGIIAALVFTFVPMDIINTLGFLSAYLALSAVQRAIWMASAGKKTA